METLTCPFCQQAATTEDNLTDWRFPSTEFEARQIASGFERRAVVNLTCANGHQFFVNLSDVIER